MSRAALRDDLARAIYAVDPPFSPRAPFATLVFGEPASATETDRTRRQATAVLAVVEAKLTTYEREVREVEDELRAVAAERDRLHSSITAALQIIAAAESFGDDLDPADLRKALA